MPAKIKEPWPRDLKVFALLAAIWAAGLTARIIMRDAAYLPDSPLEAVVAGMKFYESAARVILLTQATVFAAFAIGIATERKWGLVLALFYMVQVVMSHLIFMIAYLSDPTQSRNIKIASFAGIASVTILLYLWIRSRDLLFEADR